MTSPTQTLSWNLAGDDRLSAVLERLDSTLTRVGRKFDLVSGEAKAMGHELGAVQTEADKMGSKVSGASIHVGTFSDKVGNAAAQLGNLAFSALRTATMAFTIAGAAATAFGIKQAAANEQAQVSFEVLLGNAQKAKDFLVQLQKFAAATPFDLPSLKDAASHLLAVGVNAKDVIPIMTQLGNATAAMGTGSEGIQRAVLALQQIKTGGVVHAGDVLQLTEAGIPALDALAAHFKTTVAHIRDMMQSGQIKPEDLFAAIESGEGPAFARVKGMMDKQSATLVGVWSTFKDNAGQALASFVEPAMPLIKTAVLKVADFIPKALDGAKTKIKQIIDTIKGVFAGSNVGAEFAKQWDHLTHRVLPAAKDAFNNILKTIHDNKDGLQKLGRFVADVVIPIMENQLVSGLRTAEKAFEGIIWVLSHIVDWIKVLVTSTLGWIKMIIDNADDMRFLFGPMADQIHSARQKVDDFADSVQKTFDKIDGLTADLNVNLHTNATGPGGVLFNQAAGSSNAPSGGSSMWGGKFSFAAGGWGAPGWHRVGEKGVENVWFPAPGYVQPGSSSGGGMRGGAGDDVVGTLRVVHETPSGDVIREELLQLKRTRRLGDLGFGTAA